MTRPPHETDASSTVKNPSVIPHPETPTSTTGRAFDPTHPDAGPPPHDRRETAADPGHVVREHDVPNRAKAEPTDRRTSLFGAIIAFVLAVLGLILGFIFELEILGLIVAVIATIVGALATAAAWNDQRATITAPLLATLLSALISIFLAIDLTDTPDDPLVEPADRLGPMQAEEADVPEDPANIIQNDPTPEE